MNSEIPAAQNPKIEGLGITLIPPPKTIDKRLLDRRLRILSLLLLIAAVAYPFFGLLPELLHVVPDLNDSAFHMGLVQNTLTALEEGYNPLDFWFPTWLSGFPVFHYYQPGPYLFLAGLYKIFQGIASPLVLYRCVTILLLCLFPLANYRALKAIGFSREIASSGAALSFMISSRTYGIEFNSFVWIGSGLFSQAFALPFLPLAMAGGWKAVQGGRRTLGYAVLLACTFLSHILYGYVAVLSLALTVVVTLKLRDVASRLLLLVRFYAQSFALIAFFVLPLMLNVAYHAKSLYDSAEKFDSYGAQVVLTKLFSGALLDHGRLPILTCLVAVGLYICAKKWLEEHSELHGWLVCGFCLWVLLFFGRATWGPLTKFLPLSNGLHMERLSNGVHFFSIWLAAVGLGTLWRGCFSFDNRLLRAGLCVLLLLFLLPAVGERTRYLVQNKKNLTEYESSHARERKDFEPILTLLKASPLARVYAGHSGNWGKDYKVGGIAVYHLLSAEGIAHMGNMPFSWALTTDFQSNVNYYEPADYELFDIQYLLTDQADLRPPGAEFVIRSGKHFLYRISSRSMPFSMVSVPVAITGDKETTWYMNMSWMKDAWSKKRAHARLLFKEETLPGGLPHVTMCDPFRYTTGGSGDEKIHVFDDPRLFSSAPLEPPAGRFSEVFLSSQEANALVTAAAPGVVLFKTTYHPQWRAYLDEKPVPTMMLTPGLTGIEVPAGSHVLRIAYEPGWLKLALLLAGLLMALGFDWLLPVKSS